MENKEYLRDVFSGSFPPADYGTSLEEIERTNQAVVEQVFCDGDGILLCGVNAVTMKPYRLEDVKDRPEGRGSFVERSAIPPAIKPVWINYENTGQASGTYLEALCAKFEVTQLPETREIARRVFEAICVLWRNAARTEYSLGGGGIGWLPKPYDGVQRVEGMQECSVDQYCDVTLGLETYYRVMADESEQQTIREIVRSFADWWYEHDYAGIYLGEAIWMKRLKTHSMGASYFLYLFSLAWSWDPQRRYADGFATWLELKAALTPPGEAIWGCMNGLTLNVLERLMTLRPDLRDFWLSVARHQAPLLVASVTERVNMNARYEFEGFAADYLCAADHLLPGAGFDKLAIECLTQCSTRDRYYHIRRGLRLAGLDPREQGDDMRDAFMCELHVHWLVGYWKLKAQNKID